MAEDDDWLSNLLWTDEAHFTCRGSVNTHNCRIWATENPRTIVETPVHDEKVTLLKFFYAALHLVLNVVLRR
ncbi:uncharacterized protein TNCV_3930101 [Trichonephila clavipes]|nr:uncharacterized protein TNCV_3930101 [Trichonephila clavipes]